MPRVDLTQLGKVERRVRIRVGEEYAEVVVRVLGDRTGALEHGLVAMQTTLARWADGAAARRLARALAGLPVREVIDALLASEAPRLAEELTARHRRGARTGITPRRDPRETETAFLERLAQHRQVDERAERDADRAAAADLARRLEQCRRELTALPAATLAQRALAAWREAQGVRAFEQGVEDWTLFEAVRRPKTGGRYFRSVKQVRDLHPSVRARLLRAYRALDGGAPDLPFA